MYFLASSGVLKRDDLSPKYFWQQMEIACASFHLLFSFPMPGAGKETNLVQFHDGFEFLSFAGQASQLF